MQDIEFQKENAQREIKNIQQRTKWLRGIHVWKRGPFYFDMLKGVMREFLRGKLPKCVGSWVLRGKLVKVRGKLA
jgi:hypothetical protein